jgi:hypothetical protein
MRHTKPQTKEELREELASAAEAYRELRGEIPVHASPSNPNPIKLGATVHVPEDLRTEVWVDYVDKLRKGTYIPERPLESPLKAKRSHCSNAYSKSKSGDGRGVRNLGPAWRD